MNDSILELLAGDRLIAISITELQELFRVLAKDLGELGLVEFSCNQVLCQVLCRKGCSGACKTFG